ncbi:hypothetical protein V8C35DRAFT_280384 [Trichoderma chlorosporum]
MAPTRKIPLEEPLAKKINTGQLTLGKSRWKKESNHYDFEAVRRLPEEHDIKDWQKSASFAHFKAEEPKPSSRQFSEAKSKWTSLGHIPGVYVLHDWSSSVTSTAELAAYTTFNGIPAMSAFCDNVGRAPGNLSAEFQGYYDPDAQQHDFEDEIDSEARFTFDQGVRLQSLHEEFLAAGRKEPRDSATPNRSTTPCERIVSDKFFELYAMAAEAMDAEVARKANVSKVLGANLRNDIPEMLTADFETLLRVLMKKFGQPDLAASTGITRKAINSFLSLVEDDGVITYPDLELASMEVITEELRYDNASAATIERHGEAMAGLTFKQSMAGKQQEGDCINIGAYREGIIGAHDVRNIRLLDKAADGLFGSNQSLAASQLQQLRDGVDVGDCVIAEVELIKKLAAHSVHGGLDFYFSIAKADQNIPTLIGPHQWMRWLLGESPILTRVLELCHEYVHKRGERVAIFCETQWVQQITFATLEMAGFHINTIRSSDDSTRRAEKLAKFTRRDSGCQIFLANITIMDIEGDLHACCSRGIIMSHPDDAEILKQIHHSLRRAGQTKAVTWHMLKVMDSFNDYQEESSTSQWAKQMMVEMVLDDWYPHSIWEMIIYEFQRAYFGQPFNRMRGFCCKIGVQ